MPTYTSPAKINWFLHVTGRRDDGYHLLETVFQRIDWCDDLEIVANPSGVIVMTGDLCGVPMEKNLAYKAAMSLRQYVERPELGASIQLTKSIPMGAGLGGGSSNAATVLLALNELWTLGLSNIELQRLGVTLGADVPFFVSGMAAAFASAVGEQLQELDLPEREVLLVKPPVHVNTAAVFTHADLPRAHPSLLREGYDWDQLTELLATAPIQPSMSNDLEVVTFAVAPEVREVYEQLVQFAPTRMSGSGATVIACPMNEQDRQQLDQWLTTCPSSWQWRWCRALSQ